MDHSKKTVSELKRFKTMGRVLRYILTFGAIFSVWMNPFLATEENYVVVVVAVVVVVVLFSGSWTVYTRIYLHKDNCICLDHCGHTRSKKETS